MKANPLQVVVGAATVVAAGVLMVMSAPMLRRAVETLPPERRQVPDRRTAPRPQPERRTMTRVPVLGRRSTAAVEHARSYGSAVHVAWQDQATAVVSRYQTVARVLRAVRGTR